MSTLRLHENINIHSENGNPKRWKKEKRCNPWINIRKKRLDPKPGRIGLEFLQ
jgi:hypothetical protein